MINTNQQEDRTTELILLLQKLEQPSLLNKDLKMCGDILKDIYLSEDGEVYRHSYSEITYYMYSNHVTDNVPSTEPGTVILENLKLIADDWESNYDGKNREALCKAIRKLIDHINLEVVRLGQMADIYYKLTEKDQLNQQLDSIINSMSEVTETLREQKKEAERVGKEIAERKKEVDEIQLDVKNHNTQEITVLSIFSGVAFAFTGGFSLITGALNILEKITRQKAFLFIGLLMMLSLVLSDTIYMLIRAARHYSNENQGHYISFVIVNIIVVALSLIVMAMYFFPSLFQFLP